MNQICLVTVYERNQNVKMKVSYLRFKVSLDFQSHVCREYNSNNCKI